MIFKFDPAELAYVDDKLRYIAQFVQQNKDFDPMLLRTVAKMKYKFTPNAAKVFLNAKERTLLAELLNYRQQDLLRANSISEEVGLLKKLLERITND